MAVRLPESSDAVLTGKGAFSIGTSWVTSRASGGTRMSERRSNGGALSVSSRVGA